MNAMRPKEQPPERPEWDDDLQAGWEDLQQGRHHDAASHLAEMRRRLAEAIANDMTSTPRNRF